MHTSLGSKIKGCRTFNEGAGIPNIVLGNLRSKCTAYTIEGDIVSTLRTINSDVEHVVLIAKTVQSRHTIHQFY